MCCFNFLVISICFVLFLNKVKQKIANEKILRTAINLNTHLSLFWKYVRDSTREKLVSIILGRQSIKTMKLNYKFRPCPSVNFL